MFKKISIDCRTSPVRNHRLLLAWLLPAQRNQQKPCQKSRRDGNLLDWPVSSLYLQFLSIVLEYPNPSSMQAREQKAY